MSTEDLFDDFYRSTRQQIVLQTFLLTGDLTAARAAVREAYVQGWHHWRKVSHLDRPTDWVRPRAWRLAQRRHTARLGRRDKLIEPDLAAVVAAVGKLSWNQRRMIVLMHVAHVPLATAARELGIPLRDAATLLQEATAALTWALDVTTDDLPAALTSVAAVTDDANLPRSPIVRRAGRKRRRVHTTIASAAAVLLTVGAGAATYSAPGDEGAPAAATPPTAAPSPSPSVEETEEPAALTEEMLLDEQALAPLVPRTRWREAFTNDNTGGDGLQSVCQRERFADPDGTTALVRHLDGGRGDRHSSIQTVEVSRNAGQAQDAFDTTVGWHAGCQAGRMQLIDTRQVIDVGDEGYLLTLRRWQSPVTTYTVGVARTGAVTTSSVTRTRGDESPSVQRTANLLADSVARLCEAPGATASCTSTRPRTRPVRPLPTGEAPGLLSAVDLPPVTEVGRPWVGTDPAPAPTNPAATVCDATSFRRAGADQTRSRTFLIPQARIPRRFGLVQAYATFPTARATERFVEDFRSRMDSCEDRDLTANVVPGVQRSGKGTELRLWELSTEVSEDETIAFRTALVREGNTVAQLTLTPVQGRDITTERFLALAERAAARLPEVRKR